jgi:histone acetyltransferase (RNA polymerase elongator complex component)
VDVDRSTFSAAVERFLNYPHRKRHYTQLAFFGGNFLGLKPDHIRRYLDWATAFVRQGAVDSLRFSTRPDSISAETLALIGEYPVRTVELGVQSMDDRVLAKSQRGHGTTDTTRAVWQLQNAGYEIGLQVMTGLPGDTPARATATIQALVALNPAFVRIYPTLVMAGSPLATDYLAGRYRPASLDESVDLAARLWLNLTVAGIPVVRMGLQDGPGLADGAKVLAGPYHPAFGELVLNRIFKAMAAAGLQHAPPSNNGIVVRVNPRRLSVMIGPQRSNITTLQKKFCLDVFQVAADERLPCNQLEVDNRQPRDASNP